MVEKEGKGAHWWCILADANAMRAFKGRRERTETFKYVLYWVDNGIRHYFRYWIRNMKQVDFFFFFLITRLSKGITNVSMHRFVLLKNTLLFSESLQPKIRNAIRKKRIPFCLNFIFIWFLKVPNCEGRAGMISIALGRENGVKRKTVDLDDLYSQIQERLPAFARPLFVRTTDELEMTCEFLELSKK